MASASEREQLTGHALTSDKGFRDWLLKDPVAAAESLGIYLTEAEATVIKSADAGALEQAAGLVHKLIDGPRPMGSW